MRPVRSFVLASIMTLGALVAACQSTPGPTPSPVPRSTPVPSASPIPPSPTPESTPTASTIGLTFIAQYDPTSQILTIFSTTPGATIVYNGKPIPVVSPSPATATAAPTEPPTHTPTIARPTAVPVASQATATVGILASAAALRGKIVFKTDRDGGTYPNSFAFYAMNLDGSEVERLDFKTAEAIYAAQIDLRLGREQRESGGTRLVLETRNCRDRETLGCGLYILDEKFHFDMIYSNQELSQGEFFRKEKSWARAPVWSPANTYIAFVSDHETARGDNCVRTYNVYKKSPNPGVPERRMTNFCRNAAATTTHPSFSPDGSRLTFFSDDIGRKQVYVLDVGGDDMDFASDNWRVISNNRFNDWDPLWIK